MLYKKFLLILIYFIMFSFFTKAETKYEKVFFDFKINNINNEIVNLSNYKGKIVLLVNVASNCGFTNQYNDLQEVYDKYEGQGFTVIAIPSGDFMQEYEDNSEVKNFCRVDFSLTFPIAEITKIIGNEAHPFYKWLEKNKRFLKIKEPLVTHWIQR